MVPRPVRAAGRRRLRTCPEASHSLESSQSTRTGSVPFLPAGRIITRRVRRDGSHWRGARPEHGLCCGAFELVPGGSGHSAAWRIWRGDPGWTPGQLRAADRRKTRTFPRRKPSVAGRAETGGGEPLPAGPFASSSATGRAALRDFTQSRRVRDLDRAWLGRVSCSPSVAAPAAALSCGEVPRAIRHLVSITFRTTSR